MSSSTALSPGPAYLSFLSESPFSPAPAGPHLIMARKPVWDIRSYQGACPDRAFVPLFAYLES
jgi:hypothetical protein